jgi:hypothetical protein
VLNLEAQLLPLVSRLIDILNCQTYVMDFHFERDPALALDSIAN